MSELGAYPATTSARASTIPETHISPCPYLLTNVLIQPWGEIVSSPSACWVTPWRGVEGVYNRHNYIDEKADALARLATLIETIINPPDKSNVVPIAARR